MLKAGVLRRSGPRAGCQVSRHTCLKHERREGCGAKAQHEALVSFPERALAETLDIRIAISNLSTSLLTLQALPGRSAVLASSLARSTASTLEACLRGCKHS